ncbi:FAD/NAD(P)-binding domain-containing protein [Mycena sanguinolenta]|uniref:FAD/NAD(P)-binding domain-containing protein n=1 Tax=Mycena sanguinolenta TaxID=230812 RepID=A0A8H6Z8J0_9AGAR|nr:FAD/NAD(P)-binding domain-containing protein [Mycena sanguinolenta]
MAQIRRKHGREFLQNGCSRGTLRPILTGMADDSTSPGSLQVSVVGGGIAGLTAALALRRNGHHVQIFEASDNKTEIGAALAVPRNALRVLDHLGISRENLKGVAFFGGVIIDPDTGESTITRWPTPSGVQSTIGLFCHRGDLYEELRRVAMGEGEGPPVKLRLGAKVTACDPDNGTITLSHGEIVQADLVLGADGGHSVIRTHIVGEVLKLTYSGVTCFRTVFEFPERPELQWLTEEVTGVRSFISKEGPFRMLLMYPCRAGTLLNFIGFYDDPLEDVEGWSPKASREDIIAKFQGFHPKFLPVLDLPPHSEIFKWRLGSLPLLPTWIRGHAALVGDAAHGTLPFLAQGAATAIEDGGAIGCLFPAGTTRGDVPERLKAYQDLRKERGEFVNTGSVEQLKHLKNQGTIRRFESVSLARLYGYDAIKTAQECYEERFGNKSSAT